jgi:ferredoxin-NADP reductase
MLAGGIGVTPMMSMLEALARVRSRRDVYFFFGLRHAGDHVFKEKLNEIARQCSGLRMNIFYEQVRGGDIVHRDYDATGRISMNSLRAMLPKLDMEYYLCRPQGMMNMVSVDLTEAGVSPVKIRTESFGPSSAALRGLISSDAGALNTVHKSAGITVTFARSQISVPWTGEVQSLLEFSEINGVDISSGCLYGDCGTCMTRLLEGRVKYLHATGVRPDSGCCLPCSCRPESSVVLDA